MILSLIAAVDQKGCIGKKGGLPWHLPSDLKHFRSITSGKTVIMGRKTYESIGRALPNRRNIIITRQQSFLAPLCEVVSSLEEALTLCSNDDEVFVIGGGEIYAQAITHANRLYITFVQTTVVDGDAFFPVIDETSWKETSREEHQKDDENTYAFTYVTYERTS